MRNSILNKMANNDYEKSWILIKIVITEKFPILFLNFKSTVCSQDFSTDEQEVDFLSDLVIFKNFFRRSRALSSRGKSKSNYDKITCAKIAAWSTPLSSCLISWSRSPIVPVTGRQVNETGSFLLGSVTVITGSPWRKFNSAKRRRLKSRHGRESKFRIRPKRFKR